MSKAPDDAGRSAAQAVSELPGKKEGRGQSVGWMLGRELRALPSFHPCLLQGVMGEVICPGEPGENQRRLPGREGRGRFLEKDIISRVWRTHLH